MSTASFAQNCKRSSWGKMKLNTDALVLIENRELLAIRDGLMFATRFHVQVDEVECDALRAVQGLTGSTCLADNVLLV
ncbi:hypothetical protein PanWU01x14_278990 [Parasponia andersonii]|uniref:Uncharacterized protein n=1 Tax=Parasponia andersonii TaxID=3476 RepID=A0A2P5B230_PARAD|nr:hypothetical protein PanWU01x14_278990 [Parasponia andersonii]